MTDKQIIVTFSDGYCIVLEDNKVSIRENEFTKLCIVVGDRTNELLEFVKDIYLDNKRKEQECEEKDKSIKFLLKSLDNSYKMRDDCESHWDKERKELKQQLDQLKAENEKLKKEIRLYDCIDKWGTEQCHCACRCLSNEFCDAAEEKMKNIKQTLAYIKEIAEEKANVNDWLALEILQKIRDLEVSKLKHCFNDDYKRYKKVFEEIKPILDLYANSKTGEGQPDGTYKIMLSSGCVMVYDPKPARQALQKISEVLE